MNIDVSHKMYVYLQFEAEITYALLEKESLTICGVAMGKRRLLKKVIFNNNLQTTSELIDLGFLISTVEPVDVSKKVLNYLKSLYSKGIRNYVIYNISFETIFGKEIIESFEVFRKSCNERIGYVFLTELDPSLETSTYKLSCRNNLISKILYLDQGNTDYQMFLIRQNALRYGIKLTDDQEKKVLKLSGGDPIFVKNIIRNIVEESKNPFNIELYGSILNEVLNPLSIKLIYYIKRALNKELNLKVVDYLKKVGFLTNTGMFRSEIYYRLISDYSRNVVLEVIEERLLVDGVDMTMAFPISQRQLLKVLVEKGKVSRDYVKEFLSPGNPAEYSESAVDKSISRLRKSLLAIGINPRMIVTDKKYGFILDGK